MICGCASLPRSVFSDVMLEIHHGSNIYTLEIANATNWGLIYCFTHNKQMIRKLLVM
jgi:hypothetical protein